MTLALALSLLAAWHPAQVLVPFPLDEPQIAAAPDGGAYVTGIQALDERDHFVELRRLSLRHAAPGGRLDAGVILDATRWEPTAAGVDAAGQATALLTSKSRLAAAVAPPGGSLGTIVPLSEAARWPSLAVASSGAAVAAWLTRAGDGWRVTAAVREPGATVFGPPQTVSAPVTAQTRITLAIGSRGDALLAWTRADYAFEPASASLRRPGGAFSAPVVVAEHADDVSAAIGDDGSVALGLTRMSEGDRIDVLSFVAPPDAPQLPPPQALACEEGLEALAAAAARVLLLCEARDLEVWEGAGTLQRTARMSAKRFAGDDGVFADVAADGRALITWSRALNTPTAHARVVATVRPAGGRFSAPREITKTFAAVGPRAARLTRSGSLVLAETFGSGGRSMLAVRGP